MPQATSSIQTGAITMTAASIVPIIDWGASYVGVKIPVDAQLGIAGLIVAGAHAAYNLVLARAAARGAPEPAATEAAPPAAT